MGINNLPYYKKTLSDFSKDAFARMDFGFYFYSDNFIAQFPKGTKFKKLRDIVTLLETGAAVERTDYANTESDFIHLVPRDIKNGSLDVRDPIYLNSQKGEELESYRLMEGDILIAISSNCGDTAFFMPPVAGKNYTISHYIVRVQVNSDLYDPDFLVYYLNHPRIKTYFRAIEAGKLQQNLSKVYIRNFPIIDIPIKEQLKITPNLKSNMSLIATKKQQIEDLKEASTNLIWDAVKATFSF